MTREEKNLVSVLGVVRDAATSHGIDMNEIEVWIRGNVLRVECKRHTNYTIHMSLSDYTLGRDELRLMSMSFSDFLRGPRCQK